MQCLYKYNTCNNLDCAVHKHACALCFYFDGLYFEMMEIIHPQNKRAQHANFELIKDLYMDHVKTHSSEFKKED